MKADTEFHRRRSGEDRRAGYCRSCQREATAAVKRRNRAEHRPKVQSWLAEHPCPCGQGDPAELTVPAKPGQLTLGQLVTGGYRWDRVAAVLDPAAVRCRSCIGRATGGRSHGNG